MIRTGSGRKFQLDHTRPRHRFGGGSRLAKAKLAAKASAASPKTATLGDYGFLTQEHVNGDTDAVGYRRDGSRARRSASEANGSHRRRDSDADISRRKTVAKAPHRREPKKTRDTNQSNPVEIDSERDHQDNIDTESDSESDSENGNAYKYTLPHHSEDGDDSTSVQEVESRDGSDARSGAGAGASDAAVEQNSAGQQRASIPTREISSKAKHQIRKVRKQDGDGDSDSDPSADLNHLLLSSSSEDDDEEDFVDASPTPMRRRTRSSYQSTLDSLATLTSKSSNSRQKLPSSRPAAPSKHPSPKRPRRMRQKSMLEALADFNKPPTVQKDDDSPAESSVADGSSTANSRSTRRRAATVAARNRIRSQNGIDEIVHAHLGPAGPKVGDDDSDDDGDDDGDDESEFENKSDDEEHDTDDNGRADDSDAFDSKPAYKRKMAPQKQQQQRGHRRPERTKRTRQRPTQNRGKQSVAKQRSNSHGSTHSHTDSKLSRKRGHHRAPAAAAAAARDTLTMTSSNKNGRDRDQDAMHLRNSRRAGVLSGNSRRQLQDSDNEDDDNDDPVNRNRSATKSPRKRRAAAAKATKLFSKFIDDDDDDDGDDDAAEVEKVRASADARQKSPKKPSDNNKNKNKNSLPSSDEESLHDDHPVDHDSVSSGSDDTHMDYDEHINGEDDYDNSNNNDDDDDSKDEEYDDDEEEEDEVTWLKNNVDDGPVLNVDDEQIGDMDDSSSDDDTRRRPVRRKPAELELRKLPFSGSTKSAKSTESRRKAARSTRSATSSNGQKSILDSFSNKRKSFSASAVSEIRPTVHGEESDGLSSSDSDAGVNAKRRSVANRKRNAGPRMSRPRLPPCPSSIDSITAEPLPHMHICFIPPDGKTRQCFALDTLRKIAIKSNQGAAPKWMQPPHFRTELSDDMQDQIASRFGREALEIHGDFYSRERQQPLRGFIAEADGSMNAFVQRRHNDGDDDDAYVASSMSDETFQDRLDKYMDNQMGSQDVYCCPLCYTEMHRKVAKNSITAYFRNKGGTKQNQRRKAYKQRQRGHDGNSDSDNSSNSNKSNSQDEESEIDEEDEVEESTYDPMLVLQIMDDEYQIAGAICNTKVANIKRHLREDHKVQTKGIEGNDLYARYRIRTQDGLLQRWLKKTKSRIGTFQGDMRRYWNEGNNQNFLLLLARVQEAEMHRRTLKIVRCGGDDDEEQARQTAYEYLVPSVSFCHSIKSHSRTEWNRIAAPFQRSWRDDIHDFIVTNTSHLDEEDEVPHFAMRHELEAPGAEASSQSENDELFRKLKKYTEPKPDDDDDEVIEMESIASQELNGYYSEVEEENDWTAKPQKRRRQRRLPPRKKEKKNRVGKRLVRKRKPRKSTATEVSPAAKRLQIADDSD